MNDPYVALIVNVDWYGVQSLLADEVTRLAPYIPGLDAQVEAARRAAAQGAADGAPEPEQELNPAEPDAADEEEPNDLIDVEVEPEDILAAEGVEPAATISPPPGLEQPEQSQEGQEAQQDQVEEEVGAGDAAPAEAERQEEESDTVADFAPEDYEQDLGQVQPSPELPVAEGDEAAAEAADAEVDVDLLLYV